MKRGEQVRRAFDQPDAYSRRSYYQKWRRDAVQAFVGTRHFRRVIDYGCGDGALSIPLLGQVDELVLFDTSQTGLAAARARVPPALGARVTFASDNLLEWRERHADLVICVGVLGHVEDPFQTLSEVASLVGPGGAAIIELTDAAHPIGRAQVIYSRLRRRLQPHRYAWNALTGVDVLSRCNELGLHTVGSYRYGLPLHIGDWLADDAIYRLGLRLFGTARQERGSWMSCERLYYLSRHGPTSVEPSTSAGCG